MRILALETSGRDGSLAALESDGERADPACAIRVVREVVIAGPERTAQVLAPRLAELLKEIGWDAKTIQLVCVAVGPGSFTGLRIGVTTAKTLAYAVGAEVIGVNTLAVIARQAPAASTPLWVVMDAQRRELFAAKFVDGQLTGETLVLTQREWMGMLKAGDQVTGPGLSRLGSALPNGVVVVEESMWQPMATAVGKLGWSEYMAGRRDDLWKLLPHYYRQSTAEEKKDKEMGRQGDKEPG
jgi:tRNA threonylcarbamoyladenosine biosynthesis protein TsaB